MRRAIRIDVPGGQSPVALISRGLVLAVLVLAAACGAEPDEVPDMAGGSASPAAGAESGGAEAGPEAGQPVVEDLSYTTHDGATVLVQQIHIPASRPEVWQAFTTDAGVMSWAAPFAAVDFRLGGAWESSYDPGASAGDPDNIRSRFISYVPLRMISMQAEDAPPDFPHPEILPDLFSVFEFEDAGPGRTRVTLYGVGYQDSPEHQEVLEMFRQANTWSLRMLHRRFTEGPVDWAQMGG
ncbi:MAG TPA: SRPBCC domain-containing protein [Longimicrobiales bacterium]|nr:SRPBCC domain-containing protein [Longimicrobiales bacterium]